MTNGHEPTDNMNTDLEKQLLTWLAGALEGCEGCIEEARAWAAEVDLKHVNVADEEVESSATE